MSDSTTTSDSAAGRAMLRHGRCTLAMVVAWMLVVGLSLVATWHEPLHCTNHVAQGCTVAVLERDWLFHLNWHGFVGVAGLIGIAAFHRQLAKHTRDLAASETQARESERWFMEVFHASEDPVLLIDGERFVECNRSTTELLGYAGRDQLLMQPPSAISPPLQPDGRDSTEKASEMMRKAFEKGSHRFEWMHRKFGGEGILVEVTLTAISYHGNRILHCHWRDLTEDIAQRRQAESELVRSETKFRTLFESTSDAVMLLDEAGFFDCNEATIRIFGCRDKQDFCTRHPADLSPAMQPGQTSSRELADQRIATAKQTGSYRFEWVHRRLDTGESFPAEVLLNSIGLSGRRVLQAVVRDISERKRVEQSLRAAIEEADQANRTKSQFLATMSHELRTPLTGILGFTDLLLGGSVSESERQEYLQTVQACGQHLLDVINDVLDLSKIEAGQLQVERFACDPDTVIQEVVGILTAQAQAKGLQLRSRWHGPSQPVVVTDGDRLRQILLNLVGNAIKFTPHGTIDIVARLEASPTSRTLIVDVVDTGIGVPEPMRDSIFEPFVQADSSVTRKFGGTGLGLTICRRLAQMLGGEITVASELGKGSTFTVTVDAGQWEEPPVAEHPVLAVVSQPSMERASGEYAFPPHTVLLVEDGEINRKLLSTILERAGLVVRTAEQGAAGVELALAEPFDVILMDMQMPVLDGYAATSQLRAAGLNVPIVALTAHAMRSDRDKCLAAGCSHYVSKPVDTGTLLSTVADALGHATAACFALGPSPMKTEGDPLMSDLPTEEPVFAEIVREFAAFLQRLLSELRASLRAGDADQVAALAHQLKGSAGTAGFRAFTEPARQVEALARQHRLDESRPLIDELVRLAGRIEISSEVPVAAI